MLWLIHRGLEKDLVLQMHNKNLRQTNKKNLTHTDAKQKDPDQIKL